MGCLGRCTPVERRVNAEVEAVEVRFGEWRGSRRFVNQGQWQPEECIKERYDCWGRTPPQKSRKAPGLLPFGWCGSAANDDDNNADRPIPLRGEARRHPDFVRGWDWAPAGGGGGGGGTWRLLRQESLGDNLFRLQWVSASSWRGQL